MTKTVGTKEIKKQTNKQTNKKIKDKQKGDSSKEIAIKTVVWR